VKNDRLITGNFAAAWAARLARVDYIPAYPITPQTEIIETLAKWVREGLMDARLVQVESEHSMLTAAGAASLTGARVFSATSSQGLLYGLEMLYNMSGWRAPMVLVNVSRALAAPITLAPDHNDVLAARDSGSVQLHAENAQEVVDLGLLAYRIAEDRRVRLPAIVNLDGFFLSFTREKVDIPEQAKVDEFLPEYKVADPFSATRPVSKGSSVMEGFAYSYFHYHIHEAAQRAREVLREASQDYESLFGRRYGPVEAFMLDDAEYVLVISNSFATLGKQAVVSLRKDGVPAGLLKLRMLRPFPVQEVASTLRGRKVVAVFDQNLSPGSGGILYPEVTSALYHLRDRPKSVLPVVGGLGGKDITKHEMMAVFERMRALGRNGETAPAPMYLMRDDEMARVNRMLSVARGVQPKK